MKSKDVKLRGHYKIPNGKLQRFEWYYSDRCFEKRPDYGYVFNTEGESTVGLNVRTFESNLLSKSNNPTQCATSNLLVIIIPVHSPCSQSFKCIAFLPYLQSSSLFPIQGFDTCWSLPWNPPPQSLAWLTHFH